MIYTQRMVYLGLNTLEGLPAQQRWERFDNSKHFSQDVIKLRAHKYVGKSNMIILEKSKLVVNIKIILRNSLPHGIE